MCRFCVGGTDGEGVAGEVGKGWRRGLVAEEGERCFEGMEAGAEVGDNVVFCFYFSLKGGDCLGFGGEGFSMRSDDGVDKAGGFDGRLRCRLLVVLFLHVFTGVV